MRRRLAALSAASLLLLVTAGCGEQSAEPAPEEPLTGVQVSGEVGAEPKVAIDTPLNVQEPSSELVVEGDGPALRTGGSALLHLYLANGATGKKAATTYDQGAPARVGLSESELFKPVLDALVGAPTGSRVAIAAPVRDIYGNAGASQIGLEAKDSVVFVIDVLSADPTDVLDGVSGPMADPGPDMPQVVERDGKVTGLEFPEGGKPSPKLEVVTLVEGNGEPVRDDSLVTMNYLGQKFGASKPFDNSYDGQPVTFAVGIGQLIPGWDTGLVGVKTGSRVLLSVPPGQGYGKAGNPSIDVDGDDTLVFVVDVLGVG